MKISLEVVGDFPQLQKFVLRQKRLKNSCDFSKYCLDLDRASYWWENIDMFFRLRVCYDLADARFLSIDLKLIRFCWRTHMTLLCFVWDVSVSYKGNILICSLDSRGGILICSLGLDSTISQLKLGSYLKT